MFKFIVVPILKFIGRLNIYYQYYFLFKIDRDNAFRCIKYPQTWNMMPKQWKETNETHPNGQKKMVRKHSHWMVFLEWLCGVLTGHEISKTERGYGGGKFLDYHCRWCDKLIQVPIQEQPKDAKEMLDLWHGVEESGPSPI